MAGPGGRATGFDYLRLLLAIAVVCSHSIDVSYGIAYAIALESGPFRPLVAIILPMFFALSGFLVAGSLERCRTLMSFVGLRLIRLVPALAFETVFAAVLIGPLLTTLPLSAYFEDPLFYRYFHNIRGEIQYLLPGVFAANPWPHTVNAQLWTLPYELACYLILTMLAIFGIHRHRQLFAMIVLAMNVGLAAPYLFAGKWSPNPLLTGNGLVLCFLYGIAFYLYRNEIRHSAKFGAVTAIVALALLVHPATDYFVPAFAAYLTIYLGLLRPANTVLINHGDYSYGIFLYGFPVQQAVTHLVGPAGWHWYWNIALSLPITIGLAMLSWHFVEKKALLLRGRLNLLEDHWIALKLRMSAPYHTGEQKL